LAKKTAETQEIRCQECSYSKLLTKSLRKPGLIFYLQLFELCVHRPKQPEKGEPDCFMEQCDKVRELLQKK